MKRKKEGAKKAANTRPLDITKVSPAERELIEGLEEFVRDLKSGVSIESKYTCHRVVLDLPPRTYSAQQVKATRRRLNASQALFAQFLGVSVKTVQAWEQGKTPSEMAARFLDEIERNPAYWQQRLKDSIKVESPAR